MKGTPPPNKREPMSVGLQRNRKRRFRLLPAWLEDHLVIVTLLVVSLVLGLPYRLYNALANTMGEGVSEEEVRPSAPNEVARLATVMGPNKKWAPGSSTTLASVSMTIKNLGPAKAENVIVLALVGNTTTRLKGPSEITTRHDATYSLTDPLEVPPRSSLSIRYVCWNCPITPGPAAAGGQTEVPVWQREQHAIGGNGH